jgi:branched-subunit amino acid ABC-type transport system permease component
VILDFFQAVADGLLFGSTYALIGIGFTLIFGVMQKLNMSYAAASIGGAYCGLLIPLLLPTPAWAVFAAGWVAAAVIGYVVYVTCFRFIPLASPLATLMATVGMLLLIDEIIVHVTAGMPQNYPPVMSGPLIEVGDFMLRGDLMFVFGVCLVALVVLMLLLYRTRLGLATRAVSQQPVAAQLCGIGLRRVNAVTFVLTGALIGASVGALSPLLTVPLTVKGLIVTVIGGLGSIPGAVVAGLLVGAFENLFQYLRGVTERDIYVMLLLFVFLVFRPLGIFTSAARR